MRATRETELAARFPSHVVTAWIGNSAVITAKHYMQATDADLAAAAAARCRIRCSHQWKQVEWRGQHWGRRKQKRTGFRAFPLPTIRAHLNCCPETRTRTPTVPGRCAAVTPQDRGRVCSRSRQTSAKLIRSLATSATVAGAGFEPAWFGL